MNIVNYQTSNTDINRARIERVLKLASEIIGFNPDYISLTPNVKPQDYLSGTGSPYGWYYRSIDGDSYIQPLIWNDADGIWENFASPDVPKTTLDARLAALENSIDAKKYIQSDVGETPPHGATQITNIFELSQEGYDAINTPDPNTLYITPKE